jgi:pyruvate dehydrogenase E2 component (dihydrolipoamide acetyltransferase)
MPEIDVPMPKLSMTMEEGELIAWVKHEGDQVRAGEVICEVNSDKVEMEVESPADGTLVRLAAAEGEVVPVAPHRHPGDRGRGPARRHPRVTAGDAAAQEAEARPDGGETAAPPPPARPRPPTPPTRPAPPRPPRSRRRRPPGDPVPAARRRAAELGVDLSAVAGSGPNGLVRVADVEARAPAAPRRPPGPPPPRSGPATSRRCR